MNRRLAEHIVAILLIGVLFLLLISHFQSQPKDSFIEDPRMEEWLQLSFLELDNPLHREVLKEALQKFEPEITPEDLIADLDAYRSAQISAATRQVRQGEGLTADKIPGLIGMYWQFIFVYLLVMVLTYYGVQTLGTYRFIRLKQGDDSFLLRLRTFIKQNAFPSDLKTAGPWLQTVLLLLAKATGRGFLYLILFSPAYVIAYSIKPSFNADSLLFMVVLGVLSNGLLITYANKFFTFLVSESRRGYVNTARVKGLDDSYQINQPGGIKLKQLLAVRKSFKGHVFHHIFINARYQYVSTLKEQASFVITGLVIIEMALNIQGHLCYELLQTILFKQYDMLFAILLGIFLVVKATDIMTDLWQGSLDRRYGNRQ